MDPAALGTLMIGLETVRLDEADAIPRRRSSRAAAPRTRHVGGVVAGWLRLIADRLDRPVDRAGLATG